jgi:hypothetical protein
MRISWAMGAVLASDTDSLLGQQLDPSAHQPSDDASHRIADGVSRFREGFAI